MQWWLISLLVLLGAGWFWYNRRRHREPTVTFTLNRQVLDKHTRHCRVQLMTALGEAFDVFPKVSLSEIVDYEIGEDSVSQGYADELDAASVDLLVIDKQSGEVRCLVMLSRENKPGSRQSLVRQVCQQTKLPFLLLDVHNALSDREIRQKIMAMSEPTIVTEERTADDVRVYLEPTQKSSN